MKTVTSISGGKTSAYLAANYKTDYNVFALVRTSDKDCLFPDKKIRQIVEDKIQKPFIGTLEDDLIIYTILELEQYLGKKINWVSGITYDEVINKKGGWLPNKLHRYCTTWLKIDPIFYWWAENIGEPIVMNIGYRANEGRRVNKTLDKLNKNGLSTYKATFEKNERGQNKWVEIEWQKPEFPLFNDLIYKDKIDKYWNDKKVRFAELNNCIGCFHRNPLLLKKMSELHENKFNWFIKQEKKKREKDKRATWRSDVTYSEIKNHEIQFEINFDNFTDCDSGYCGI
jgi:hypothetical protein